MSTAGTEADYQFEGFVLDLARGALFAGNGEEIPLRRKSFELLRLLVENAGRLLDRDTINRMIWPDVVVIDNGIAQCVRDIRGALGDKTQRILKTVPRRGYVFAAEATAVHDRRRVPTIIDTTPVPDRPSIAVLPFVDLSADPEQEHFFDGIADDVIAELSRNRLLSVLAANSSFTYRGGAADIKAAREQGARYVLRGSVRREDKNVRINAQLIDAKNGNYIWAERYDCKIQHGFAAQDEISSAVVAAVQPAMMDTEFRRALRKPPEGLGAWEAYQRGLWHMERSTAHDNEQAKHFFQRAATFDSTFASAYVAWAQATLNKGVVHATLPLADALTTATNLAHKAFMVDPADTDAHAPLARVALFTGDANEARERVKLARSVNPNCRWAIGVEALILLYGARPAEARQAMEHRIRIDRRHAGPWHEIAISYYYEREYPRAVEAARRIATQYPDFPATYRWLAAALGQLGRREEAQAALRKASQLSPQSLEFFLHRRPVWHRPEDYEHMIDGLRKAGWDG